MPKTFLEKRRNFKCRLDPDEFQFFFGSDMMVEYQEFQEAYFDIHVMMVMFILCVCFFLGRCNVSHPFDDGVYFTFSFGCTVTSFLLYHISLFCYALKYFGVNVKSPCYTTIQNFVKSEGSRMLLKDTIAIIGVIGVGIGLYARVVKGQCVPNVSVWEAQRCNPVASSFSLPQDHVIFLLILPLHCQSVINGMTFRATLICWVITVISIITTILLVGGALDIWIVHLSFFILSIAYKNEKLARLTFAHNKKISLAEEEKVKYIVLQQQTEHQLLVVKNKHELEILSIKAEEECRLMAKEKKQMVALIGNVAHDLKTPLQSFLMDLESLMADPGLKKHLDSIPDDHDGPRHILQSLESTCCFMSMAINRSIDFAKASKSIALVPLMESFSLPEAAFLAVNVIRHLTSSLKIIANTFPPTMCLDIITDKQWFTENILCLLSNAVKYSNGGIVTLTVTHITTPVPPEGGDGLSLSPSEEREDLPITDTESSDYHTDSGLNSGISGLGSGIPGLGSAESGIVSGMSGLGSGISGLGSAMLSGQGSARNLLHEMNALDSPRGLYNDDNNDDDWHTPRSRTKSDTSERYTSTKSDLPASTSTIMISIEDAGIGISEEAREGLFQPFKQVQRLAGGTGLGLYSLSNRIRALNGTRGVRSRGDGKQGSVFWFAIPYRPDPHFLSDHKDECSPILAEPLSQISSMKGSTTASQGSYTDGNNTPDSCTTRPMRFLIIDDSSSILKVLGRALTNKKYEVETADNGSAGLNRLIEGYASRDFDVVLMDLQMPVMDGIEAVRRYREFEAEQMGLTVNTKYDNNCSICANHATGLVNGNSNDNTDNRDNNGRGDYTDNNNDDNHNYSDHPIHLSTPIHPNTPIHNNTPLHSSTATSPYVATPPNSPAHPPLSPLSQHLQEQLQQTQLQQLQTPHSTQQHHHHHHHQQQQSHLLSSTDCSSILRMTSEEHSSHAMTSSEHSPNAMTTVDKAEQMIKSPSIDSLLTPRHKKLFIIGMSANSDEDTKQCALNAGMSTFLSKPFTLAELLPIVDHLKEFI